LKTLFLPPSAQATFFETLSEADIISVVQLLGKLSNSLKIVQHWTDEVKVVNKEANFRVTSKLLETIVICSIIPLYTALMLLVKRI
jgi:hypothetical protein